MLPERNSSESTLTSRVSVLASKPIILTPALSDQAYAAGVCHDRIMIKFAEQTAYPR